MATNISVEKILFLEGQEKMKEDIEKKNKTRRMAVCIHGVYIVVFFFFFVVVKMVVVQRGKQAWGLASEWGRGEGNKGRREDRSAKKKKNIYIYIYIHTHI